MTRKHVLVISALLFLAVSASANNRSAVSVNGLDTNPCTVASPCRSISVALGVTAFAGEVIALDSAGYGPFTIGQSVSVSGAPGIHAAITVTGGDGVDITGGPNVFISNLTILGTGGGVNGIRNTGSQFVHIQDCFIEGFSGSGILNSGTYPLRMLVDRVTVDVCANGINFDGGSGAVAHSSINQCTNDGVRVYNHVNPVVYTVTIASTDLRFNTYGVEVSSDFMGYLASAKIEHCSFHANGVGVQSSSQTGGGSQVFLIGNDIDSTAATTGYTFYSTGDNFIGLNGVTLTSWARQ